MPSILHINTTAGKDTTVGRFVANLQAAALNDGWSVSVAAGFGEANYIMHQRYMHILGALMHRIAASDSRCFSKATMCLIDKIKALQPDIVHLHNLHGYYLNVPLLADFLLENRIITVMTVHDCRIASGRCAVNLCAKWIDRDCSHCPHPKYYPAIWQRCADKCPEYRIARDLAPLDLHLIAPSPAMKEIICKSELSHIPVSIISNGVDTHIFNSYNRIEREGIKLLAVANQWSEAKNFDALLHLASRMPTDWALTIAGKLSGQQRKNAARHSNIHVTGVLTQQQLVNHYLSSSVTLSPSLSESFGMTLSESIACGTPVVANAEAFPKAYIPEGCGEYTPFSCPEDVLKCIQRVKGIKPQNGVVSTQQTAASYLQLYRQILGQK